MHNPTTVLAQRVRQSESEVKSLKLGAKINLSSYKQKCHKARGSAIVCQPETKLSDLSQQTCITDRQEQALGNFLNALS